MDALLILRNIEVTAANAIAGLTWGFPAITHFLGFVHALERKLPPSLDVQFDGVGVVCHEHQIQAYQANSFADHAFALTRNPLGKDGGSASFNEEGRINMRISLLIPIVGVLSGHDRDDLLKNIEQNLQTQHLAGGLITNQPRWQFIGNRLEERHRAIMYSLLPGFTLVSRHPLLQQEQARLHQQGIDDAALEAWLNFSRLTYRADTAEESEHTEWHLETKPDTGWLKPITVGYRPIAPLHKAGAVGKTRDTTSPAAFVENIYSIGEWMSPHRIKALGDMIWRYTQTPTGDYLCQNPYQPELTNTAE
ncbi:MAG: type I-F CRISPR-associated protein Csy2 [Porticoccaceae bacterium]|nr:type I-F CRISPR-associated protein Csy2 [Porticoccaceae bacterium]